jgi:mRNA-degrading endonuclease HigB of HigAB toxin-antitoxin module
MRAKVKITFDFDEIDVKNLMLQKGYSEFTKEELAYELTKLNIKELGVFAYYDSNEKEIILE